VLEDAQFFLQNVTDKLVIIDEVQRLPSLFPLIRTLVDIHRVSGRFLLLGSADPSLLKGASESLAGRICIGTSAPNGALYSKYDLLL
jgi:predicted AAA+ superfamily ATPase